MEKVFCKKTYRTRYLKFYKNNWYKIDNIRTTYVSDNQISSVFIINENCGSRFYLNENDKILMKVKDFSKYFITNTERYKQIRKEKIQKLNGKTKNTRRMLRFF
jgi:hypothetical protein